MPKFTDFIDAPDLKKLFSSDVNKLVFFGALGTGAGFLAGLAAAFFRESFKSHPWDHVFGVLILASIVLIGILALARFRLSEELGTHLKGVKALIDSSTSLHRSINEGHPWLVPESLVVDIESKVDDKVLVLVPNLEYEMTSEYKDVIATNLANSAGPTYLYITNTENNIKVEWGDLVSDLKRRVALINPKEDLDRLFASRFLMKEKSPDAFPCSALHGCVIYQFRNGDKRCFMYVPKKPLLQQGLNLEFTELGRDPIRRIRTYFAEAFPSQYSI